MTSTPEMVERVARAIYELLEYFEPGGKPMWVEGGNSPKQDEVRRMARAAIEVLEEPTKDALTAGQSCS